MKHDPYVITRAEIIKHSAWVPCHALIRPGCPVTVSSARPSNIVNASPALYIKDSKLSQGIPILPTAQNRKHRARGPIGSRTNAIFSLIQNRSRNFGKDLSKFFPRRFQAIFRRCYELWSSSSAPLQSRLHGTTRSTEQIDNTLKSDKP